jgi:hypothetical protein
VLPADVEFEITRHAALVDRVLPGRLAGLYVVGSTALGAFVPGKSDIDFVAVLDGDVAATELARLRQELRRVHSRAVRKALTSLPPVWPLVCNGVYVRREDLARRTADVKPICGHVARQFAVGEGFDVNPVTWSTLARGGITVRGPEVSQLGVRDDDEELRAWTRGNLDGYWRRWARAAQQPLRPGVPALVGLTRQYGLAWGVLGAPRLHCTIATGEIISKEQGGVYALETFDASWRPLIEQALGYWRSRGTPFRPAAGARRRSADFITMVADAPT